MAKIVYNTRWCPKSAKAMALVWWVVLRLSRENHVGKYGEKNLEETLNHEKIHIVQQKELLILPFFILWISFYIFYFVRFGTYGYYMNPLEREAKINKGNKKYLETRKFWAWVKYIKEKK